MKSRLAVIALVLMVAVCTEAKPGKQTAANPGAVPPDTTRGSEKPGASPRKPGTPVGGRVAAKEQHIEVSNSMNMPMMVTAVVGDQTQALGTVEPKQQASFTVQVPTGVAMRILGSDSSKKHQVQATLIGVGPVLNFVIR